MHSSTPVAAGPPRLERLSASPTYPLLMPNERDRLRRLFPRELEALPGVSRASEQAWDERAHAYLLRLRYFRDEVARMGADCLVRFQTNSLSGALVLTWNGAVIRVGAPLVDGTRQLHYLPLSRDLYPETQVVAPLLVPIVVGRPCEIGPLHVSTVRWLAEAGYARSLPEGWTAGIP